MRPLLVPTETDEGVPVVDPEALIEEARQRQRRRRRRVAATVIGLACSATLAVGILRWAVSGKAPAAGKTPRGMFVNRSAFAGHGLLAFVSRGRLFVLDGSTQKLRAVTGPRQDAEDPRFSPGGAWLAYTVDGRRLAIAHADGSSPHLVSNRDGGSRWLPDGTLLMAGGIFNVTPNGRLARTKAAPSGLVAWSPDGDRFAFVSRTIVKGRNGAFHGVERLQVADSVDAPRTTWLRTRFSFTRRSGMVGAVNGGVVVLPHHEGILYWVDPGQSNSIAADGMSVYELRAPMAKPVRLAVTVGDTVSIGPGGRLGIGAGGNRYAWITKNVVTCSAADARCSSVPTPAGRLTLGPAWSPDGKTLAFVEAEARREGDFRQATIARWYATHTLWLLRATTRRAVEVAGTQGAASPIWSSDGASLLYVAGDALWLIPALGARPEKIAGPLFLPGYWPSYYGQIGWAGEFAWTSPSTAKG